jgi:disulfide bond formation protein DsbB
MLSRRFSLFVLVVLFASACAFAPRTTTSRSAVATTSSSTQLAERQWNFNEGRSPWGLKKNAEIWNGRLAQMAFVFVFLQELVTGKGVIQGVQEGDTLNIACLGVAVLSTVGLTAWLAIQGTDEYADEI